MNPDHVKRRRDRVISGDRSAVITGSDRKVRGGVEDSCRLCESTTKLQLSHVVPRWAYRWMKGEGTVLGIVRSREAVTANQDGAKHYLLCASCEQHLGDAENYVALFTRGRRDDLDLIGVSVEEGPVITGLNMSLVYRCLVGVLIKAHFSASPPFSQVTLNHELLQQLKARVRDDDYDTTTIGVMATKWVSCHEPGINPRALMFARIDEIDGTSLFSLLMGGIEWFLRYDGPRLRVKALQIDELSNGPSYMMFGDITEYRGVNHGVFHPSEVSHVAPWVDFPRDSMCPCGLGESRFRDCCATTWVAHAHRDYGDPAPLLSRADRRRRRRMIKRLREQNERMRR